MAEAASGDVLMPQALALHQQGRLQEAEPLYAAVARQQPDNADVRHLLGIIALQTGRPDRAVDLIGEAIALNAGIAAAYNNRAIALRRLGRLDEALDSLDRAHRAGARQRRGAQQPRQRAARSGTARCGAAGLRQGDCAASRTMRSPTTTAACCFARWDSQRPLCKAMTAHRVAAKPCGGLHYNRGNALLDLTRREEALASFDTAIALDPERCRGACRRAATRCCELGRTEQALASYDQAIALRPDYAEAYGDRGNMLRTPRPVRGSIGQLRPGHRAETRGMPARISAAANCCASRDARTRRWPVWMPAVEMDPLHGQRQARRLHGAVADHLSPRRRKFPCGGNATWRRWNVWGRGGRSRGDALAGRADRRRRRSICPIRARTTWCRRPSMAGWPAGSWRKPSRRHVRRRARPPASASGWAFAAGISAHHTMFKLFLEGWLTEIDRDRFEVIGFHTGRRRTT